MDGNRAGAELVEQILRMPGDEPPETGVAPATPEP
jgi:hypothetical protein